MVVEEISEIRNKDQDHQENLITKVVIEKDLDTKVEIIMEVVRILEIENSAQDGNVKSVISEILNKIQNVINAKKQKNDQFYKYIHIFLML